jgi:hypothetical protein
MAMINGFLVDICNPFCRLLDADRPRKQEALAVVSLIAVFRRVRPSSRP